MLLCNSFIYLTLIHHDLLVHHDYYSVMNKTITTSVIRKTVLLKNTSYTFGERRHLPHYCPHQMTFTKVSFIYAESLLMIPNLFEMLETDRCQMSKNLNGFKKSGKIQTNCKAY